VGELVTRRDSEAHGLDVAGAQVELDAMVGMFDTLDGAAVPARSDVSIHIETLGSPPGPVETGDMNSSSLSLPVVVGADIRIGTGSSRRFVGADHGAEVSYFYVENQPGEGPGLHWHPYAETWVVLDGEAQITIGDETVTARAGDTATGPAFVPHRFVNVGAATLRILCIHPSATIIQTFLSED